MSNYRIVQVTVFDKINFYFLIEVTTNIDIVSLIELKKYFYKIPKNSNFSHQTQTNAFIEQILQKYSNDGNTFTKIKPFY